MYVPDSPADLALAPELAERAREVREIGFVDEKKRRHKPWSDRRYYGRRVGPKEPYCFPMIEIGTGQVN